MIDVEGKMMNEIIMINITTIFSLLILYLCIFFSQNMSKANTFYGVLIKDESKDTKELKRIDKAYKQGITIIFAISVILEIIIFDVMKLKNPLNLLWIIGLALVFYYIMYLRAYKKVKSFKASKEAKVSDEVETQKKGKKIVDIDFINEKNRLKKVFSYLYAMLALVVLGITVYTCISYKNLPQKIPTHWNLAGEADAWAQKSFFKVFFPNILHILLFVLLVYFSINIFSMRIKLDPKNIENSKKRAIQFLKGISISLYILTSSIVFLLGTIALAMLKQTNISPYIMLLDMVILFFSLILLFYYYYKYGNNTFTKEKEKEGYSVEDEDKYWIAGFIYNNPDDPLVIVEKRYGLGWTINVGHTKGKLIMLFLLIFIVITIISPFVFS